MAAHRIEVVPSGKALGAEIRGVDLAELGDLEFAAIERAWGDHLVLLFRDQRIDDAQQIAFSKRLGPIDKAPNNIMGKPWLPAFPEMTVVSNIIENGVPIGALGAGEAIWHTDMSYEAAPPAAAVLRAIEIPRDGGGDTWFANMYAAYESLPADLKARTEGLRLLHDSSTNSAGERRKGAPDFTDPREAPGARHPIVRRHPMTGRHALYLGRRRNAYVDGLDLAESEALLDALWAHATKPSHTWAHQWRCDDVVVWDNRCTLHRRDAFDSTARRLMHRTQIEGTPPV